MSCNIKGSGQCCCSMRTVAYNFFTTTVTPTTNMGSLTVVKQGRIKGVQFNINTTGAAAAGLYRWETVLNNVAGGASGQLSILQRSNSLIAGISHTSPGTAGLAGETTQFVPCDIPVSVGDVINFGGIAGGTAATTGFFSAQVIIDEKE